jgi:hypothetical protein
MIFQEKKLNVTLITQEAVPSKSIENTARVLHPYSRVLDKAGTTSQVLS